MSDKDKRPPASPGGEGGHAPPGKPPGKKTRTASLPATGDRVDRLRAERHSYTFDPIEIGKSETKEVRLKNDSSDFLSVNDFWVALGQSEPETRDVADFSVAGDSEAIAPHQIVSLPVTFAPRATDSSDTKKKSLRKAHISLLDEDGAVEGSFNVAGTAQPESHETRDAKQAQEALGRARRGDLKSPTSYRAILADLRAAKEMFVGSDLEGAHDLVEAVVDSWYRHMSEDKVGYRFRGYGASRQNAVTLSGEAQGTINKLLMFPNPVEYDLAIEKTQAAEEVIRVMYGEAKEAPGLKALDDASLPSLAGDAAVEVGETVERIATDAAFAAGFGKGSIEGVYEAVRDLVVGVADAAKLGLDLAKAFLTGGMIGVVIASNEKLAAAAKDMASAVELLGPEVARRWREGSSYDQGHFRGEVVGYVVAQIALLVLTSGESAAAQASGKWAAVVRALRTLDAMGDILQWGELMRGNSATERVLHKLRSASKAEHRASEVAHAVSDVPDAPHVPNGNDTALPKHTPAEPKRAATKQPAVDACFVAGTKVLTGSGLRPIEDVAIGIRVLATDVETGNQATLGVLRTFVHTVPSVLDVSIGDTTVTCSPAHPFWVIGRGWSRAGDLRVGDKVTSNTAGAVAIGSIEQRDGQFVVHNLSVDGLSTYHVSELGILVHNKPAHLDLEADFKIRKQDVRDTIAELRDRIEKIRVHANTDEQIKALEKLEREVHDLEVQIGTAKHMPMHPDDDPAARFDPLAHIEDAENRALKKIETLEREMTPKRKIPESRPALDSETVLADGTGNYTRTGHSYHGRRIYRGEDGRLYYVDNLHNGAASEIEVFSATGNHLGTMSPEGVFDKTGKVEGRYLPKNLL